MKNANDTIGNRTRDFPACSAVPEPTDERGCTNGAFLSEEAQCGGRLGEAPLVGTLEDTLRKALDTAISLHRGPVGEPGGDWLAETFERKG